MLLKAEDVGQYVGSSDYFLRVRRMMNGQLATHVVADYLREFWKHILDHIRKHLGRHLSEVPFQIVITVPAVWKSYARKDMLQAARMAGIPE